MAFFAGNGRSRPQFKLKQFACQAKVNYIQYYLTDI